MALTGKMKKALEHYARHRSKTAAYEYAYNTLKMKPDTIRSRAWDLFNREDMKAEIAKFEQEAAEKIKVDAAWVRERAALLASFNIKKFIKLQPDGSVVYDFSKATDDDWYCIDELVIDKLVKKDIDGDFYEVERTKAKAPSKIASLKLLGSHKDVQAFKENVDHNHTGIVGVANMSTEAYKAARREMLDEDDC